MQKLMKEVMGLMILLSLMLRLRKLGIGMLEGMAALAGDETSGRQVHLS